MHNYPPTPYPSYHQDGSHLHSRYRRKNKHRYTFHPTVTDDLDDYDDDYSFHPQSPVPSPYWGHSPQYGGYPQSPYPAPYPYPYPPQPQYPPPYPGGYDPRRPESNFFGMILTAMCLFGLMIFGAAWYGKPNEAQPAQTSIVIPQSPASTTYVPSPAPRNKPVQPKPFLRPITHDQLAVFVEAFGTEAEVRQLSADLKRTDIRPVQMGEHTFWACILVESVEQGEQVKDNITARYEQNQWAGEHYIINLRDNCDGLEWRGEKLVCGEK